MEKKRKPNKQRKKEAKKGKQNFKKPSIKIKLELLQ